MHCGVLRNVKVDTDIKPCPFCGGKAEFVLIQGDDIIIRCSSCHASTEKCFWRYKHAVRAWNKRRIVNDHFSVTEDIGCSNRPAISSGLRQFGKDFPMNLLPGSKVPSAPGPAAGHH